MKTVNQEEIEVLSQEEGQQEYVYKVIVVGDGGVGKTTFINRYATDHFFANTQITICAEFYTFEKKVNGGTTIIKLQVWDFGGERRFRFILPDYCKGARGAVFAFDLTRSSTLWNLEEWMEIIHENANNPISLAIGTKKDKIEEAGTEKVSDDKIEQFIKKYNISPEMFFKTSALTGENISDVFDKLFDMVHR